MKGPTLPLIVLTVCFVSISLVSIFTLVSRVSQFRPVAARLHTSETFVQISYLRRSSCPPNSLYSGISRRVPSDPDDLAFNEAYLNKLKALPPIPKIIHLTWSDRGALESPTPLARQGVRRLLDMNPDWQLHFADDQEMDAFLQEHLSAEDWALLRHEHITERTHVWRLLVMYHQGGFYQSMTRVYNQPLSKLLRPETKMLLPLNCGLDFAQDLMCSPPCNDLYLAALQLNLERRRALGVFNASQTEGGKRPRNETLFLGSEAYFNAVTLVLFGQMLAPRKETVDNIFTTLLDCPFLETSCEKRCITLTHQWSEECWNVTRGQLHEERNVKNNIT